jgi:putative ABC transport system substrate-binding protein
VSAGTRFTVILALVFLAAPLAAGGQQPGKIARVGRLSPVSASADARTLAAFRQGLRELGWIEGQNIAFEYRFAEGKLDRLPDLAAELVGIKVDLILAASTAGALAARRATGTIPIVMVTLGGEDPVASGLIVSLARPGRNLTGVTGLGQELSGKRLQLLKEAVPSVSRVAVLANPADPEAGPAVKGLEAAARALGVQRRVLEVRDPSGIENAFRVMTSERAGGLMVVEGIMLVTHRRRILELAAKNRLPTMFAFREFVVDGGRMSYGASLPDMHRRAATHVDKILKGAKPADLPVEQPTKFELVINLKTAKALGLTIPQSVLVRADQVIQ